VVAHVDDEEGVGETREVLDAADRLVELLNGALEVEGFLLRQLGGGAVLELLFHFLEALDGAANRLEVRERAAEPALVDPAAAGALSFLSDDFATAALRVDEEDAAALARELTGELAGFIKHHNRLFEVDDVNLVAGAENVLSHLRVPETGLMTEVATRFEHFTHADHLISPRFCQSDTACRNQFFFSESKAPRAQTARNVHTRADHGHRAE